jgi:hypothetical protein
VVDLSQSTVLAHKTIKNDLPPADGTAPRNAELRVNIAGGWSASEGSDRRPDGALAAAGNAMSGTLLVPTRAKPTMSPTL